MIHLKLFETESQYSAYTESDMLKPNVSHVVEDDKNYFNSKRTYLTFEIIGDGDIKWETRDASFTRTIEYKKNDGEWTEIISTTSGTNISVVAGDLVQFRGKNKAYGIPGASNCSFYGTTARFNVYGNIMSLVKRWGFYKMKTVGPNAFKYLFEKCTGLTSAENLVLPATTLATYCYNGMFQNCKNLTSAPELPATALAGGCYGYMFRGCTSLTSAPELPATALASNCYYNMFQGCTSLTTAPSRLPAETLADGCYGYKFCGCTKLTSAPELPATTLASSCYYNMFQGCTSLTTAPELPAVRLAIFCYSYMFMGCTSLTSAPELPATTLTESCYNSMFYGCTNLNYIKCLATNISARESHISWVYGVASSGTFVKAAGITEATWGRGNNGIPTNWTVQNA